MIPQINYHPSDDLLACYHRGELPPGASVAIAAHLELCDCCARQTEQLVDRAAEEWAQAPAPNDVEGFDDMLSDIFSQPRQPEQAVSPVVSKEIHLLERSVEVPRILAKAAGETLHWKKLPGGINHANIALDRKAQCDFLYMKPGSQIPRHKHQGMEITLVLDGTFTDDSGDYHPGDFVVRSGADCHSATSDKGCLCFTVLENPVIFTSGFARFFNPINRLLFNRAPK